MSDKIMNDFNGEKMKGGSTPGSGSSGMMENSVHAQRYNELAGALLSWYAKKNAGENLVLSPFSVLVLLAMAADATGGATRDEIVEAICGGGNASAGDTLASDASAGGISAADVIEWVAGLEQELTEGEALQCSNVAIVQERIADTVVPGYEARLEKTFGGKLFASGNIVHDVNAWVREKTHGMIDSVADDSMREMLLCLANAIAFEAEWQEQYEDTQVVNEDFRNADGSISRVKMLVSEEKEFVEDANYTGFVKPYKNTDYSYMALLPKDENLRISPKELRVNVTDLYRRRERMDEVNVTMPEFKFTSDFDLKDICQEMGIRTAFTPEADFSGISETWLMLESIVHKAHIEVDRQGTKAAAVTMGVVCAAGLSNRVKYVTLDRPFLFAIMHNGTGLPVFVGVVNHLAETTDADKMTREEKRQICDPIRDQVFAWILDEDGVCDHGTKESEYFWRTMEAYDRLDVDALRQVRDEVRAYQGRKK